MNSNIYSGIQSRVMWWKYTYVSKKRFFFVVIMVTSLLMEAAGSAETLAELYPILRRHISDDSNSLSGRHVSHYRSDHAW